VTDDFLAALGTRVRLLRVARNLTQQDLADASGIHRTAIGSIEHGTVNFGVDSLPRLANALDTTAAALIPPSANTREPPPAGSRHLQPPDDLLDAVADAPTELGPRAGR
jgi:transcriptional regulator with XRE-family HTH domain